MEPSAAPVMAWLAAQRDDDWEPLSFGEFDFGEVSWVRRDERMEVGFFRVGRAEYESRDWAYTTAADQVSFILEGGTTIEVDGKSIEAGVGDVLSITAGATVRSVLSGERFCEFFVQVFPEGRSDGDMDNYSFVECPAPERRR